MTSIELFSLISKPWASVTDIQKIASCGKESATNIRNTIKSNILKSGKNIPNAKEKIVPMKSVVEYLDIDIEYITTMAKNEVQLQERKV